MSKTSQPCSLAETPTPVAEAAASLPMPPDADHPQATAATPLQRVQQLDDIHPGGVSCVAISSSGQCMVSGGADTFLQVWALKEGVWVRGQRQRSNGGVVNALALEGNSLVVGTEDSGVRVWRVTEEGVDMPIMYPMRTLKAHVAGVFAIALPSPWQPQEKASNAPPCTPVAPTRVASTNTSDAGSPADDMHAPLRRTDTEVLASPPASPSTGVSWAVSGSEDETVCVWDVNASKCAQQLRGHKGWVMGLSLAQPQQGQWLLLSVAADHSGRLWRSLPSHDSSQPPKLEHVGTLKGHADSLYCGLLLCGHHQLHEQRETLALTGSEDKTIRVWSVASCEAAHKAKQDAEALQVLEGHKAAVCALTFQDSTGAVVSGSEDATLKVWSQPPAPPNAKWPKAQLLGEGCTQTVDCGGGQVMAAKISADGQQVVLGVENGAVQVWAAKAQ